MNNEQPRYLCAHIAGTWQPDDDRMDELIRWLREKADRARIAPFVVWVILTSFQGMFGDASYFWMYAVKTVIGAWMVWAVWPVIREMRWSISLEAVAVGILVFGLWVGLEGLYPPLDKIFSWDTSGEKTSNWNAFAFFGEGSFWAWFFIVVRFVGSVIVVPPLEEVLYRSFLYRWLIRERFEDVPVGEWNRRSFIITGLIFGLVHGAWWLPGILCGFLYQWLVIRRKSLGDAMTAHAITNFLLGIYVVTRDQWIFW
jgi:hypothetical protein